MFIAFKFWLCNTFIIHLHFGFINNVNIWSCGRIWHSHGRTRQTGSHFLSLWMGQFSRWKIADKQRAWDLQCECLALCLIHPLHLMLSSAFYFVCLLSDPAAKFVGSPPTHHSTALSPKMLQGPFKQTLQHLRSPTCVPYLDHSFIYCPAQTRPGAHGYTIFTSSSESAPTQFSRPEQCIL